MKKDKNLITLVLIFSNSTAFAAGTGNASVFDLRWPALNFIILFGFLIFKLRKPISKAFTNFAEEVKQKFNHSSEREKEANLKLEMYKQKVADVEHQTERTLEDAKAIVSKISADITKETAQMVDKIHGESMDKLNADKKNLLNGLNKELLDVVIAKTKGKIKSSNNSREKISNKLINQL